MFLSLIPLVAATLFAGAATYISLVEHPARMSLDDRSMLSQWQQSYKRALPLQAGLAVIGGVAGLVVWSQLRNWPWLVGSVALLANWPFTLSIMLPTNKCLMAIESTDASGESRALLIRWGQLHDVRSGLGWVALIVFAIGAASSFR